MKDMRRHVLTAALAVFLVAQMLAPLVAAHADTEFYTNVLEFKVPGADLNTGENFEDGPWEDLEGGFADVQALGAMQLPPGITDEGVAGSIVVTKNWGWLPPGGTWKNLSVDIEIGSGDHKLLVKLDTPNGGTTSTVTITGISPAVIGTQFNGILYPEYFTSVKETRAYAYNPSGGKDGFSLELTSTGTNNFYTSYDMKYVNGVLSITVTNDSNIDRDGNPLAAIWSYAGENGSISPAGERLYSAGNVYTINANTGYEVDTIYVLEGHVLLDGVTDTAQIMNVISSATELSITTCPPGRPSVSVSKSTFPAIGPDTTICVIFREIAPEIEEISVTFDKNANDATGPDPTVVHYKKNVQGLTYRDDEDGLLLDAAGFPAPTRVGYVFLGWFTAPDGGTQVNLDDDVDTTESFSLYAHWGDTLTLANIEVKWIGGTPDYNAMFHVNVLNGESNTPVVIKSFSYSPDIFDEAIQGDVTTWTLLTPYPLSAYKPDDPAECYIYTVTEVLSDGKWVCTYVFPTPTP